MGNDLRAVSKDLQGFNVREAAALFWVSPGVRDVTDNSDIRDCLL